MEEVLIVSAVRTPIGSFGGSLKEIPAHRLGSIAISEAVKRAKISPSDVEEVVMGNVLQAGQGQNPAARRPWGLGFPRRLLLSQ